MRRFGYERTAGRRAFAAGELGYCLSYLAHLGGVLLVNPRRALVQGRALLHSTTQTAVAARGEHAE